MLSEILMLGDASGAFVIEDAQSMAKILQDAGYRFTSPAVFHEGEFNALATELNGVIDLILDGFAWRAAVRSGRISPAKTD